MKMLDTQAGDDSEGKMWGLEASSLFIVIGGVVSGVIVTVASFSYWSCPPMIALGSGTLPAILGIIYVFTLRERRPKSFDKDLLETLICGRSWTHNLQPSHPRKPHPLFLSFIILCLILSRSLHAQFIPSLYSDVKSGQSYEFTLVRDEPYGIYVSVILEWAANNTPHTANIYLNDNEKSVIYHRLDGSGADSRPALGGLNRFVEGPLKAGTKIRLKGVMEAPGDPSARIFSLGATPVTYDAAVNLTNLERQVNSLEGALQSRINQNTGRINELAGQIIGLKTELNGFRQRFDVLNLDYSQFKTDIVTRLDALEKRIASVEDNLNAKIAVLGRRFDNFDRNYSQFKSETNSGFAAINEKNVRLEKRFAKFQSDHSGFKAHVDSKFDALDKRHSSLENKFGTELSGLSQRLENHYNTVDQNASVLKKRLSTLERRTSSRDRLNNTLGIIGVSVGGAAALLAAGGAYYHFLEEHRGPKEEPLPLEGRSK